MFDASYSALTPEMWAWVEALAQAIEGDVNGTVYGEDDDEIQALYEEIRAIHAGIHDMDQPEDDAEQEEREQAIVDLRTTIKEQRATLAQLERAEDIEERGVALGGSDDHEMDEGASSHHVRELHKTLGRMRESHLDDMAREGEELKKAKDAIQAELGANKQTLHKMREASFDDTAGEHSHRRAQKN